MKIGRIFAIFSSLWVVTALEAKVGDISYVGVDVGYAPKNTTVHYRSTSKGDAKEYSLANRYTNFTLKIGTEGKGKWGSQMRISKISYAKEAEGDIWSFGLDIIRDLSFAQLGYMPLFAKAGFGFDFSVNAGIGMRYGLMRRVSIVTGVDYTARYIEFSNAASTTDSGLELYFGVNYAF